MVKIAVTAIGFMGKAHLAAYSKMDNMEIAALCDIREEALQVDSLEAGGNIDAGGGAFDSREVRKYLDFGLMLKEGGFDMVDICLPTYLHAEYAIKALEAGYHVFCEKPLAINNGETRAIIQAVRKSGRYFGVGHCLRFWPAYREMKKIMDGGEYGKVRYAELSRFSIPPTWAWDNWLLDSRRSGNAALDLHIHDVDMVLFLFGRPEAIRSRGVKAKDGGFLHISTLYKYPNLDVVSTGGWMCPSSYGFNMRAFIILEKAAMDMDFHKDPVLTIHPREGKKYSVDLPEENGYFYEMKDFAEGIETGRFQGLVTAETAAEAVRLALLEIESAEKEQEIEV